MNGAGITDRTWQDIWGLNLPAGKSDDTVPGRHLSASLAAIRKILPLTIEKVSAPDPAALAALSRKIQDAATSAEVVRLAHQLTSRELEQLFPLLAALPPRGREARHQAARLTLVIRERACPTLHANGWLVLQKHYPARRAARALAILSRMLASRQSAFPSRPPAPLRISQIAAVNSRFFVRRLIRHLEATDTPLRQFLKQFQIRDDLPLGAELIARSFLSRDHSIFLDGQQLFSLALRRSSQPTRTALLHHFFRLTRLPPNIRNQYCQQIYRQFGDPAARDPIWKALPGPDVQDFQNWVLAATIGSHCRQHPQKARLYLRHADSILRVEHWDENTLLLHFAKFLIADSRSHPQLALYYAQPESGSHPFHLASPEFSPNPADPAIPHRQVDDAISHNSFQGTIGLPFDPEGIRLTGIFLNLLLGGPGGSQTSGNGRLT